MTQSYRPINILTACGCGHDSLGGLRPIRERWLLLASGPIQAGMTLEQAGKVDEPDARNIGQCGLAVIETSVVEIWKVVGLRVQWILILLCLTVQNTCSWRVLDPRPALPNEYPQLELSWLGQSMHSSRSGGHGVMYEARFCVLDGDQGGTWACQAPSCQAWF